MTWVEERAERKCRVCGHVRDERSRAERCGATWQGSRESCACRCNDYRPVWVVRERGGPYVEAVLTDRWVLTPDEVKAQRYELAEAIEVAAALPLAADVEKR